MLQSLHLVSLNVERSKHMDRILPFLERVKPDVVCLMELMEHDIARIAQVAGSYHVFEPMNYKQLGEEGSGMEGLGIFSRFPLKNTQAHYYHGEKGVLRIFDGERKGETNNHMLLVAEIDAGNSVYKIGTTHFPVTPKGFPDDVQWSSIKRLLGILKSQGEIVFCGDFNAPRGGEIAAELIAQYKDNVPSSYTMSLDTTYHRVDPKVLAANAREVGVPGQMVDYIFSTPGYTVSDFAMESGLSDHQALIATVSKN